MNYFSRRPFGWQDDNRAYLVMAAQGVKEKPESIFPSLAAIKQKTVKSQAHALVGSGFFDRLLTVAKTNGVDWNPEVSDEITGKGPKTPNA